MKTRHSMPFGAELLDGGGTRFRLWAPGAARVRLLLDGLPGEARRAMDRVDEGWHELVVPEAGAGTRYRYMMESGDPAAQAASGLAVPDPASRSNPDDVHGASQVVDPLA
ncbi:MAG: malto-oligosyltrehalose trehalohydrolase, partial [Gammaproteobacteria bacterium]